MDLYHFSFFFYIGATFGTLMSMDLISLSWREGSLQTSLQDQLQAFTVEWDPIYLKSKSLQTFMCQTSL